LIGRSVADRKIRLRGRRKSAGCDRERDRKTKSIHFTLQKMSFEKRAISHRRPLKAADAYFAPELDRQLARAGKAASVKAMASARSSARCRARLRNLDILVFLQKRRAERNRPRAVNII
jgi:hypothetical protein